ncbi:Txe/YoeB family addiction module toxin [Mucilaginibacter sp. Mucisp84]|uniref:Txe/YoeB family addiction module toxin n=1 Tax=Mucilaginibacter sp. Mucisp84 TaxID=3243058 RepID=UPI0039A67875
MEIIYSEESQKDIQFWKKSGNKIIQNKIQQLLNAISQDPFNGIGKPEMLKHNLTGLWSRRINQEHRIVYEVLEEETRIKIHSMKGHY